MTAFERPRRGARPIYWEDKAKKVQLGALTVIASQKLTLDEVMTLGSENERGGIFLEAPFVRRSTAIIDEGKGSYH